MSRIAIIDTAVDPKYIGWEPIEFIDLCADGSAKPAPVEQPGADASPRTGGTPNAVSGIPAISTEPPGTYMASHGSLCAMVLDRCTTNYDLVNIRIFETDGGKVSGNIEKLVEALQLCLRLGIDVISMSSVSSLLSDSRHLYDITRELSKSTVILSALDNKLYATVPTGYPHVIGVRNDRSGFLAPGELAYDANDLFGANLYANCNFSFLRGMLRGPSNSFAVPMAAAYINELRNKGHSMEGIWDKVRSLRAYPAIAATALRIPPDRDQSRSMPIVCIMNAGTSLCSSVMDRLFEPYEVQSVALSYIDGPYDIRIRRARGDANVADEVRFMELFYKTDMVFVLGGDSLLEGIKQAVEIDIVVDCSHGEHASFSYEETVELVPLEHIADRLHDILTAVDKP